MSIEVPLVLAYIAGMAAFFAFLGRRRGFWWVAAPLVLGAGLGTALLVLELTGSGWLRQAALGAVLCPVLVAFSNRLTGYRWWPPFAVASRLLVPWLVVGGVLLSGTVGLLIGLLLR